MRGCAGEDIREELRAIKLCCTAGEHIFRFAIVGDEDGRFAEETREDLDDGGVVYSVLLSKPEEEGIISFSADGTEDGGDVTQWGQGGSAIVWYAWNWLWEE